MTVNSINSINQSSMLSAYIAKQGQNKPNVEAAAGQKPDSFEKKEVQENKNDTKKSKFSKKKIIIIGAIILAAIAAVIGGLYFTGRLTPEQKHNRALNNLIDVVQDFVS